MRECDDLEDAATATGPAPSHAPALMACAAAAALVLAGGVTVVVMRVRNDDSEPEGLNWWFVAWFVVGLTYAVVGAALLTRARGRILGVCFIVIGAAATATAIATQYPGIAEARRRCGLGRPADRRTLDVAVVRMDARRAGAVAAAPSAVARRAVGAGRHGGPPRRSSSCSSPPSRSTTCDP